MTAAVFEREKIVALMPQSAGLYEVLGLPVNLRGLVFQDVTSELVASGESPYLLVEGEIANVTGHKVSVPPVEISIRGTDGQPLYAWTTELSRSTLDAGEKGRFRGRLASPPTDARNVMVLFGSARGKAAVASRAP